MLRSPTLSRTQASKCTAVKNQCHVSGRLRQPSTRLLCFQKITSFDSGSASDSSGMFCSVRFRAPPCTFLYSSRRCGERKAGKQWSKNYTIGATEGNIYRWTVFSLPISYRTALFGDHLFSLPSIFHHPTPILGIQRIIKSLKLAVCGTYWRTILPGCLWCPCQRWPAEDQ